MKLCLNGILDQSNKIKTKCHWCLQNSSQVWSSQVNLTIFFALLFISRTEIIVLPSENVNCYNFPCWHSLLLMANWIKSLLEPIKYLVLQKKLSTSYLFWNTVTFRGPLFYKWVPRVFPLKIVSGETNFFDISRWRN